MTFTRTSEPADRFRLDAAAPDARANPIPPPAVPLADGLSGFGGLSVAYLTILILKPPVLVAAWLVLFATAAPMLRRELRRAAPTTTQPATGTSPLWWIAGFIMATAPLALIHGQGMGLELWGIAWMVVTPAFVLRFGLEYRRNGAISAGFPAGLGKALRAPSREAFRALMPGMRLWALKGFFVPLYGLSLLALMNLTLDADFGSPVGLVTAAVAFAYTVDLAFGVGGYIFASNALAPTIRSTQPRLLGWIVCLACYGPIIRHWPDFEAVVTSEVSWPTLLSAAPPALAGGVALLLLLALYAAATVCFGLRFSNLSNRGIITTGPYRLMKHPAYFAHVANAWIICFLLPGTGLELGLAQWLVPIAFTIVYRLRATTEEQHLSEDPDYRAYADWIARHGLLARLRRLVRLG